MPALRFDAEQRFTCRSCARCCTSGWEIVLTQDEVEEYRRADVARLYREPGAESEGAAREPFEPLPGRPGRFRIRKRPDRVCGFLSPENRCRIHETLGFERKPLTCRVYPFRFHPGDGAPLVTAHFGCPTVAANDGARLGEQIKDLARLERQWSRAWPEPAARLELVAGRRLPRAALGSVRATLRALLDRRGEDGSLALRTNLDRIARLLDDWTRHRVLRLKDDALVEYLELTGRHAAEDRKPLPPRPPGRLARLLFRGFLFAVAAGRVQLEDGRRSGLRLGLRLRLFALALHMHGLWPAVAGYDLRAARRPRARLDDAAQREVLHNYLRAVIETLGSGRSPLADEIGVALAILNGGITLAAMRAGRAGESEVSAERLRDGLGEAADLSQAGGALPKLLATLAGGAEAAFLLVDPPLVAAWG